MTYRSEKWRRAVASLACINCGLEGSTQAAHPNHREKGLSLKSPDCWCVPLCFTCHTEFDQGRKWSKESKRVLMDSWIIETIKILAEQELVHAH